MSKREKHVRRERKKTDRARRRVYSKWTGAALAAIVAFAVPTQAEASPIRFDNPPGAGHFEWMPPLDTYNTLDLTLPAGDQPGLEGGPSTLRQDRTSAGGQLTGAVDVHVGGLSDLFVIGLEFGESIPTGAPWSNSGYIYYEGYDSELPEGETTYLGARLDLGSGYQYGWVEVVREWNGLHAFAWGYETDPGVPIPAGAPEPGTLALLAFGALAAVGRRPD